jgi:hypothetical protein
MQGRGEAALARHDEAISLAWHIEALSRSNPKRLPNLAKLLARRETPKERQTADEMLAVFRAHQAGGAPMNIKRLH